MFARLFAPELGPRRWTSSDLSALRAAAELLENPSGFVRLLSKFGNLIDGGMKKLSRDNRRRLEEVVATSLRLALDGALCGFSASSSSTPSPNLFRAGAAASGAVSGALGLTGALVDLPVSTGLILRSVAEIARSKGEDLEQPEARLACIEVFALGGRSAEDDHLESAYFLARIGLGKIVGEASKAIARGESGPALAKLVTAVAARFFPNAAQKVAAAAIPIIGAVVGSALNFAFITHYQCMAEGHFEIRRLSRSYGAEEVRARYEAIVRESSAGGA